MPLDLIKRGEVGSPLTATQHDNNLTAVENSVNALEVGKVDLSALSELVDDRVAALLTQGSNVTLSYDDNLGTLTISSVAASNTFSTVAVAGQSNVVADGSTDTLTLAAGTNVSITTDAPSDTITINATPGKLALTISAGVLSTVASSKSYFTVPMTENITSFANPTGLSDGQILNWRLAQDATGGRTVSGFGTMFKFPGGIVPDLSTGANDVDLLTGVYDQVSNTIMAFLNKNFA